MRYGIATTTIIEGEDNVDAARIAKRVQDAVDRVLDESGVSAWTKPMAFYYVDVNHDGEMLKIDDRARGIL